MTKQEAFAREALRSLQRYDHVARLNAVSRARVQIMQEDLGEVLGLVCNADDPRDAVPSHSNGTCPIHEWIDEGDGALCPDPDEGEDR